MMLREVSIVFAEVPTTTVVIFVLVRPVPSGPRRVVRRLLAPYPRPTSGRFRERGASRLANTEVRREVETPKARPIGDRAREDLRARVSDAARLQLETRQSIRLAYPPRQFLTPAVVAEVGVETEIDRDERLGTQNTLPNLPEVRGDHAAVHEHEATQSARGVAENLAQRGEGRVVVFSDAAAIPRGRKCVTRRTSERIGRARR